MTQPARTETFDAAVNIAGAHAVLFRNGMTTHSRSHVCQ
ncbi:hypothetical protein PQZ66_gp41 [Klebsiella phage vB_KleM_KB2]|nr:hypothetical protein PQZ66_gp41 [Klebsiella phage vB_KleM_KB2]